MKAFAMLARVTPGALLCRGLTFGFTLIALILAMPRWMFGPQTVGVAIIAAALAALLPGTRAVVTLVLLLAIGAWIVSLAGATDGLTLWGLIGFTSALYLAHTSAALAAVVPLDANLAPEVLLRWYSRAALLVVISAMAALVVLAGSAMASGAQTTWIASVAGIAAAAGVVGLLVRMFRRT